MKQVFITLAVVLGLEAGIFLIYIYGGIPSFAADAEIGPFQRWLFNTALENSVESRADAVIVPQGFDDRAKWPKAASHYDEMCARCHGAPGVAPNEFAKGLNPSPPEFAKHADEVEEWTPAQMFWVTKHGIEMTGMPAWGPTHADEDLWAVVGLVRHLPGMSPDDYQGLVREAEEKGHSHGREESAAEQEQKPPEAPSPKSSGSHDSHGSHDHGHE